MRSGPFVAAALVVLSSLVEGRLARADDAACIAANDDAIALRKAGKLREALRPLAICADPACPAEVKADCAARISDIGSALPTLTLVVQDRKGNDLTQVTVTMDGAPLAGVLSGQPIPLDPGEHTFRFAAPGQPLLEKKMVLRAGEKNRREIVLMGAPPPPSFWTAQRVAGLTLTAAGVVGLGVGAVFGGFAISAKNRQNSDCTAAACAHYLQSVEDYDTAGKNATGATIGFVAGGVLVAGGVVLFLTAPKPKAAPATGLTLHLAPLLAGSGGGLSLGGSF